MRLVRCHRLRTWKRYCAREVPEASVSRETSLGSARARRGSGRHARNPVLLRAVGVEQFAIVVTELDSGMAGNSLRPFAVHGNGRMSHSSGSDGRVLSSR